jgi:glucose-6-phosphate 1-dehydrogenase
MISAAAVSNEEKAMQERFDRLMTSNFSTSFQQVERRMEKLSKKIKYLNSQHHHPNMYSKLSKEGGQPGEPQGILLTGIPSKLSSAQQAWMKEYAKYHLNGGESPPHKRVSFNDIPLVIARSPSPQRC